MRHRIPRIVWGYLSEAILTSLTYVLLIVSAGEAKLVRFVSSTAGSWSTLVGILIGLSVALFVLFVHSLSTDFGDWLITRHADGVFKTAFMYTLCVNVLAFSALVVAGYSKRPLPSYVALGLLIYALTNFVSTIKNVSDLLKLQRTFRLGRGRANSIDSMK